MPDRELDDDWLDLSPEVVCMVMRRRSRNAAMAASPGQDDGARPPFQASNR